MVHQSTPSSRGIQSIEVGGELLKALVRRGQPMALKDLAAAAGLPAARAHPYLVSFSKVGLIEQDPDTSHYRLGSLAIEAGLISLQQVDPVRLASDALPALPIMTKNGKQLAADKTLDGIDPKSGLLTGDISINEEIVHGIPGTRVLLEGDVLSIDCGAQVGRWNGDAAVTVVVADA